MSRLQRSLAFLIIAVYSSLFLMGQLSLVPRLRMPFMTVYSDNNTTWLDDKDITLNGILSVGGSGGDENLYLGSAGTRIYSDSNDKLTFTAPSVVYLRSSTADINIDSEDTATFNSEQNVILSSPTGIEFDSDNTFTLDSADVFVEEEIEFGSSTVPKTYFQPFYDGLITSSETQQVRSDYGEYLNQFSAIFVAPFVIQGSYIEKVQLLAHRPTRDEGDLDLRVYRALASTKNRLLLASSFNNLDNIQFQGDFTIEMFLNESLASRSSVYVHVLGDGNSLEGIRIYGVKWFYYQRRR